MPCGRRAVVVADPAVVGRGRRKYAAIATSVALTAIASPTRRGISSSRLFTNEDMSRVSARGSGPTVIDVANQRKSRWEFPAIAGAAQRNGSHRRDPVGYQIRN